MYMFAADDLQALIAQRKGLEHIEVKKHGKTLKLMSTGASGLEPHARLSEVGRDVWRLDLPDPSGRWESTPFTGSMEDVLDVLVQQLGWHLEPHR